MAGGLAERLKSLGYIASLVNSGSALPEILERIVVAICQRSVWSSSAIMAIDEAQGYSVLVARYDPLFAGRSASPERWELATSPTKSALESGRPIVIEDAQTATEFAGYRREAIERDYRTVVLLPLSATDEQGRGMVMSVHSHEVQKVDADEVVFLETVAHLASLAVDKAHKLRLEAEQSERLRTALEIHNLAMEQVLANESLEDFVGLCRRHLKRPFVVIDLTANQLLASGSPAAGRFDEAAWRARLQRESFRALADIVKSSAGVDFRTRREIAFPVDEARLTCEAVVAPCVAAGSVLGGLILFTQGQPLDAAEALTSGELRAALSVLLLRRQIRFQAQAETHGEFFSRLFSGNWRDAAAMLERARYLALPLEEPARLAVIKVPGIPSASPANVDIVIDIERALARLARQRAAGATAFFESDSFVVFLPERKRGAKAAHALLGEMLEEVRWLARDKAVACLSRVCTKLDDYREARRDCARVLELAGRIGRSGIVADSDFGSLARLIAASDPDALRQFVSETIGRIEAHDGRKGDGSLLATIEAYLACGGRYQAAAEKLGIHVTTLRYRLRRASELFNLDLDDLETRVALEVALRVRSALPQPGKSA